MCASIMFRCDNSFGAFVLLFFLLQPLGIIVHKAALGMLRVVQVHPLLMHIFNISFTLLWLFFTLPLLFEDNIICGFWGE
jgi:predicted membrane protein